MHLIPQPIRARRVFGTRRWVAGPLFGALLILAGCGGAVSAGVSGTTGTGAATTAATTTVPATTTTAATTASTTTAASTTASAATTASATSAATSAATTTASASGAAAASTGGTALLVRNDPKLGTFLTDSNGKTLYWYTKDTPGVSNCSGACLAAWPPLLASAPPALPSGVPGTVTLITRTDGGKQVAYNDLPLYYFAKDTSPTDTAGQGVGKVWYVMVPSASPPVTPTPSS